MINNCFVQHLLTLVEDPVPNIRFNVSQSLAGIHQHFNAHNRQRVCQSLQRIAAEDTDFDSKFFAQRTLETIMGRQMEQ